MRVLPTLSLSPSSFTACDCLRRKERQRRSLWHAKAKPERPRGWDEARMLVEQTDEALAGEGERESVLRQVNCRRTILSDGGACVQQNASHQTYAYAPFFFFFFFFC